MSVDCGNDLQTICELRWKSIINNKYNTDKVNIVGILNIAENCADWTTFKSYLMQNSDAKEGTIIAYVDDDGEEIQINSENYQLILEYCKEKARKHEKVILTLEEPKSPKEHQYKNIHNRMKHHDKLNGGGRRHHEFCTRRHFPNPFYFVADISDSEGDDEQPPLWFLKYMKKFKQEMRDLIVESMYCMMANGEYNSPPEQVQVLNDKKKTKKKFCDEDSSDCVDGFTLGDRLLKKVHKLQAREKKIERKYEAKIGKLEHKVKRIIDKKTGLRSEKPHTSLGSTAVSKPKKHCSASTQNSAPTPTAPPTPCQTAIKVEKPKRCYSNRLQNYEKGTKTVSFKADKSTACCENYAVPDEVVTMNAIPLNRPMITEFAGRGEIITKRWEVMNNGLSPWTDETELRFTWGSSTLVPLKKVVKVPHLKPGETGIVEVTMQAPDALGRFESYWYFFHSGIRFGNWLGCAYVIGLQKDDRCRMGMWNVKIPLENAVDLTTTKCPRYYQVDANKCTRYHHISATTDDMKMSKSNTTISIDSANSPVNYVVDKPEKFVDETVSTSLKMLMNDNGSTVECLKPNSYEPIKSNDELLNLDHVDKISNTTVPNPVEEDDEDEEIHRVKTDELNSDSDSDNISVISGTISVGSTDHGDDFVVIPMPELQKSENVKSTIVEPNISPEHNDNILAVCSSLTTPTDILQETSTNTEVVEKPISYVQSTSENNVDKPPLYLDLNELNKIEKPSYYVSSTTLTNDSEKNTEKKIIDDNTECIHKNLDSKVYQPRPFIFAHCNFGDPNCGSGPNGPRFPPSCHHTHSNQTNHPTWRNGCSVFGNDFATCGDQTKKPDTVDGATQFESPYPGAQRFTTNADSYYYPYPGCINPEHMNHSSDSNTRRFVFNNSGIGFETYPQQESELSNEIETNIECEVRKPARYSYIYGEGKPISTNDISKSNPPQPSPTNLEIPTTSTSSTNGVYILPETIVNGAIQAAANAFNTACNVYDMIRGEGENNNNGQSVSSSHNTPTPTPTDQRRTSSSSSNDTFRSANEQSNPRSLDNCLHILYEMGFYNRELNIKLLKRYHNDLPTVISKLV